MVFQTNAGVWMLQQIRIDGELATNLEQAAENDPEADESSIVRIALRKELTERDV